MQIIKINHDTQRISLGMKQLQTDPWEGVSAKYPVGAKFTGKVTNVTDYGAFVELEPGVEGLVHVSEMSWVKKNMAPSKIVTPGTDVEVVVLEVDSNKRRISLGLKQAQDNPWDAFEKAHPPAARSKARSSRSPNSACSSASTATSTAWSISPTCRGISRAKKRSGPMKKGQVVKAQVLDVDTEKERVSLGIKQLSGDPIEKAGPLKKNSVVTVTVTEVNDGGIEVALEGGAKAFIRRSDLARDRADQRPERFGKGGQDRRARDADRQGKPQDFALHQGARNLRGEGSRGAVRLSDSGASLGDILGAALKKATKKGGDEE